MLHGHIGFAQKDSDITTEEPPRSQIRIADESLVDECRSILDITHHQCEREPTRNDTSWASTAPKPRTITAVAARGPQVFMSALRKGVDDAAYLALIGRTRTAWSGCAFRAVRAC